MTGTNSWPNTSEQKNVYSQFRLDATPTATVLSFLSLSECAFCCNLAIIFDQAVDFNVFK